MKKYLLSMLIAMFAIVSFAQPTALKQKGVKQLTSFVGAQEVTPNKSLNKRPNGKNVRSTVSSFKKIVKKQTARRTEGEFTVDDLAGDYIDVLNLYDYEDETSQYPTPCTPFRKAEKLTIEAGANNQIIIYGLWGGSDYGVTGTVNLEDYTVTIPAGQVIYSYEGYGEFKMMNAESETGLDDFTARIYSDGIEIEQLWFASLEGERYSEYFTSFLAYSNGNMQYVNNKSELIDAPVFILQDTESKTVSVYNFGDFGVCVDIDLLSDKTFFINADQVVYNGGTKYGNYSPFGLNETATNQADFVGKATETTLISDVNWTLLSNLGYWFNIQQPFTIELVDGSEFEFPNALPLVTLPEGLTPVAMPSYYTTGDASNREKHTGTINVAVDGTDIYFQGIDLQIPSAWAKGTLDAETGFVTIPVTYMGVGADQTPHYFGAYGDAGDAVPFTFEFNKTTNTYYSPDWVEFYATEKATEVYYYSGLLIGTKPTAVVIPEGLATETMPYTGKFLDTSTGEFVEKAGSVKVAKSDNGLVYIQGLYSDYFESDCILGQMIENEGTKYLFVPAGEYVGEYSSGFLAFVLSYTYNQETKETSPSNIIFVYDEANNCYQLLTPLVLSRSSYNIELYSDLAQPGLLIGTITGINALTADRLQKSEGAWYTIGGQRVAQPTQKGLYIHNGKKVVIK